MRRFLAMLVVLLAAPLVTVPSPAALAQQPDGPIRFVPTTPEASVKVNGKYPPKPELCPARQPGSLHAAYRGVLEVGRRSNGQLYLVTELTFPEYLNGIAEVPRDWPLDALKAQVVAARTYAISHMNPSTALARELRYDLCSTDACQVYRGLNVERGAWGSEWSKAVAETQGEILRHDGKPAQTFYFSTSNGRTYSNADGFGGDPLPYLKPVTEQDDGQSPTSRWTVRMPLTDLTESLRLAEAWSGGAITSIKQEGERITVSGEGPAESMTLSELRNRLNAQAVCLTPKRYPTPGPHGMPLPQVVPSKWATVTQQGPDVVIEGRGWGHGVGMVQWGLKGKAERGMSYADMLSFYYGGLRPEKVQEPDRIRVSLATELDEITLERRGPVTVEGAGVPEGPVKITGGEAMTVSSGEPIPPRLRLDAVSPVAPPAPGGPTSFTFDLSAPAIVRVDYAGPQQGSSPAESRQRASQTYNWDPAASGLPVGAYEVAMVASDGVDEVRSVPARVDVAAAPPTPPAAGTSAPAPSPEPSPSPRPQPSSGPSPFFFIGFACLGLAAIITGYLVFRARSGLG
jgi:stage II sporulation protein D